MRDTKIMLIIVVITFLAVMGVVNTKEKNENIKLEYEKQITLSELSEAADIIGQSCLQCHAIENKGQDLKQQSIRLDDGTLHKRYKDRETLETFIQKEMPANDPGTLTTEESRKLARYLWNLNQLQEKRGE